MQAIKTKKTVYICHPIGGDVKGNIKKVIKICEEIHRIIGYIPVVPYLVSLLFLNDEVLEDRELGEDANLECLRRKFVDEVWLYGDRISDGMKKEIILAWKMGIPVLAKTQETVDGLKELIEEQGKYFV